MYIHVPSFPLEDAFTQVHTSQELQSHFSSRDWMGSNGILYLSLRYGSSSKINIAKSCKTLINENPEVLQCKIYFQSSINLHSREKRNVKNLMLYLFLSFFFLFLHTYLKNCTASTSDVRTELLLYYQRFFLGLELHAS